MRCRWPLRVFALAFSNYDPLEIHSLWRWREDAERQRNQMADPAVWEIYELPLNWFARSGEQPPSITVSVSVGAGD